MPARYRFFPEHECLYLRFEDPFLFGQADEMVKSFTSDPEFTRTHTLVFDLSRLTNIKIDVTRSAEKAMQLGPNFPMNGGQIIVLAPTETGQSLAELLRGLWANFPHVEYQVFGVEEDLFDHLGIGPNYWNRIMLEFEETSP